jgi:polar amino acid transport system substrate-binding protein
MKLIALLAAIVGLSHSAAAGDDQDMRRQLAPTGRLRIGVAFAPSATPVFVARDADGALQGLPIALGQLLASRLGLAFEFVARATTGELVKACAKGEIDIGFIVIDEERRQTLDFAPPYFIIESTYLATGASQITNMAEVDRADVTVVGIEGSTTFRAAGRSLSRARLVAAQSVAAAMEMLAEGKAAVMALSRDAMPDLSAQLPGSRIIDGAFQVTGVAIAVGKNRPLALAALSDFTETAKQDGTLRHLFDHFGWQDVPVAPPQTR